MEKLKKYIDFTTVCPETDIGCGVPRKPLRLVMDGNRVRMLQHETGSDVTDAMQRYTNDTLSRITGVDGILLKERSPSCGTAQVKIYSANKKGAAVLKKGSGIFGGALKEALPFIPCSSEGHLYNFALREHFYTAIFTLARFRATHASLRIGNLVDFHARHKFILMSYNQTCMRQMGNVTANHVGREASAVFDDYHRLLLRALVRPPRLQSPVNVLMHGLGYFREKVSAAEKKYFINSLDFYKEKKIPLSTCNAILQSWIIRFNERYLASQYFFNPFPEELIELSDSGK